MKTVKGFGSDHERLKDALEACRAALAALSMSSNAADDSGLARALTSPPKPNLFPGCYGLVGYVTELWDESDPPRTEWGIDNGGRVIAGAFKIAGNSLNGFWITNDWHDSLPWQLWQEAINSGDDGSTVKNLEDQLTSAATWLDAHADQVAAYNSTLALDIDAGVSACQRLAEIWALTVRKWKDRGGKK